MRGMAPRALRWPRACLAALTLALLGSAAPARAQERWRAPERWVDTNVAAPFERCLAWRVTLADLVLYPPTAITGVLLALAAGAVRLASWGHGTPAYVHVIEIDGVRTEYTVTDQGEIMFVRVGPSRASWNPLDDDPGRR